MEYQVYKPGKSPVSTREFHADRPAAPHLEQRYHQGRMYLAAEFVRQTGAQPAVDLGCGDGGLLSLLKAAEIESWGYDFCPANITHANKVRGVDVRDLDVAEQPAEIQWAPVVVMTEVLEHMDDPHGFLKLVAENAEYLVASSPYTEHQGNVDACHAWAWDVQGYKEMIEGAGFNILKQQGAGSFQVVLASTTANSGKE